MVGKHIDTTARSRKTTPHQKIICAALFCVVVSLCLFIAPAVIAHDVITTPVTWNREISRIFYSRCSACHREGGSAFSLMEYQETFPWRTAIKEEILERRMPPWG